MNDAYGDDWYNYDSTYGNPLADPTPPAPVPATSPYPNGVPPNSGNPAGYMDIAYWNSRGVPTDQIFDTLTGQLKPGWTRTGNGYERTGAAGPTAPPPTGTGDLIPMTTSTRSDVGGGQFTGGGGFGGWPTYNAPGFADPGTFNPGSPFSYKDFSAPQGQDVLKDPGFQFRMDQGRKALEASAAGKGVLRAGGTLKDLLSYGQNFASQEYGNVFNRALQEYDTNRKNAFDTYSTGYQGRKDQYGFGADRANSLNSFNVGNAQFDFSGRQRQAEQEFQDLFNRWSKEGDWTKDLALGGID